MLRMKDGEGVKVYTRHETGPNGGDREYYDLKRDPYQLHNALRPDDPAKTPPAPDGATLAYYEDRLDALYGCAGQSCRAAEDAPPLPGGPTP
jgi:hypothetical protein